MIRTLEIQTEVYSIWRIFYKNQLSVNALALEIVSASIVKLKKVMPRIPSNMRGTAPLPYLSENYDVSFPFENKISFILAT